MATFLNGGDGFNKSLMSFMVQINGLLDGDGGVQDDGQSSSSAAARKPGYLVGTGAGRFLRHYADVGKKRPNVRLAVNPAMGANDGLVSATVETATKTGIAARSWVVVNYGATYDFEAVASAMADSDAKKLKGMLQNCVSKISKETAAAAAGVLEVSDAEGEEDPAEAEAKRRKVSEGEGAAEQAEAVEREKKRAEEESAKKKADEESAKKKADEESAKKKAAEESAKKKADEESAKKKAAEESAKKKAAEESAKKKADEEAAKTKAAAAGAPAAAAGESASPTFVAGETLLGKFSFPWAGSLFYCPGVGETLATIACALEGAGAEGKGRKIVPQSILWVSRSKSGNIMNRKGEEKGILYAFGKTKTTLVASRIFF